MLKNCKDLPMPLSLDGRRGPDVRLLLMLCLSLLVLLDLLWFVAPVFTFWQFKVPFLLPLLSEEYGLSDGVSLVPLTPCTIRLDRPGLGDDIGVGIRLRFDWFGGRGGIGSLTNFGFGVRGHLWPDVDLEAWAKVVSSVIDSWDKVNVAQSCRRFLEQ